MSAVADPVTVPVGRAGARRRLRFLRHRSAQVALVVIVALLAVAFLGGILAPHDPEAQIGVPFGTSSSASPLGLDYRGEDVFSRVLAGAARSCSTAGRPPAGLPDRWCDRADRRLPRWLTDPVLMRLMDVLLAFPAGDPAPAHRDGFGNSPRALILGVVLVQLPSIARSCAPPRSRSPARLRRGGGRARGFARAILRREILPNVVEHDPRRRRPRFTVSILLIAAVNFLGLGLDPPAADWALMISENRAGITINPWAVLAPGDHDRPAHDRDQRARRRARAARSAPRRRAEALRR